MWLILYREYMIYDFVNVIVRLFIRKKKGAISKTTGFRSTFSLIGYVMMFFS